jgi:hypothetical protein
MKNEWTRPGVRRIGADEIAEMARCDPSGDGLRRVRALVQQALNLVEESGGAPSAVPKLRQLLDDIHALVPGDDR